MKKSTRIPDETHRTKMEYRRRERVLAGPDYEEKRSLRIQVFGQAAELLRQQRRAKRIKKRTEA